MIEKVNMMESSCKWALWKPKEKSDEDLKRKNERMEKIKYRESCSVRDNNTITMDDKPWLAGRRVYTNSAASFSAGLVRSFKESSMRTFMDLVRKVGAECGENVLSTEVQLHF